MLLLQKTEKSILWQWVHPPPGWLCNFRIFISSALFQAVSQLMVTPKQSIWQGFVWWHRPENGARPQSVLQLHSLGTAGRCWRFCWWGVKMESAGAGGGSRSIFSSLRLLAVNLCLEHESWFLKANSPSQYILRLVCSRVFIKPDYYFIT